MLIPVGVPENGLRFEDERASNDPDMSRERRYLMLQAGRI
jgi:hypothetical protein